MGQSRKDADGSVVPAGPFVPGDEFEYMGVPLKAPSADLAKPLDLAEGCWCAVMLARSDVLYRFAADEASAVARFEILEGTKLLCQGRREQPIEFTAAIWIRMYGLGFNIVRDAVDEAKATNPELVRRGAPPPGIPDRGRPGRDAVKEAQVILNVLGFRAGPEDGSMGRLTTDAIGGFQQIMGIQVTSELDARTMSLLRNCLFGLSERQLSYRMYDPEVG
jgi:hypothetical protein